MKDQIKKLKIELKSIAKTIKYLKSQRCKDNNGYVEGLLHQRWLYRHKHVIYCMLRGRELEQIDSGIGLDINFVNFHLTSVRNSDQKLYVLVDSKLKPSQQAVQASHAVASFLLLHPNTTWSNGTLVLLKTPFKDDHWPLWINRNINDTSEFREPDLKNRLTAIAIYGPHAESHTRQYPLV